jgi:hypothetical protein
MTVRSTPHWLRGGTPNQPPPPAASSRHHSEQGATLSGEAASGAQSAVRRGVKGGERRVYRGKPRPRVAITLRWISLVPPPIGAAVASQR